MENIDKMRKTIILFVILSCNIACNQNKITHSKQQGLTTNIEKKANKDRPNCLGLSDTILNADNWVKYFKIGEKYLVAVKVNKVVDTLDFKCGCNTPAVLVPTFLWKKHNSIFLTLGSGFNFRELLVCTQVADSIMLRQFRSDKDYDAQFDFAYKFDNERYVHLYDGLHKCKRKILLPLLYKNKSPILYTIFKKRLELEFADSVLNTSVTITR